LSLHIHVHRAKEGIMKNNSISYIRTIFSTHKTAFLLYSLIFLLCLSLLPRSGYHVSDMLCWTEWAKFIYQEGLGNVYKVGTDYLPLYHYILYLYGMIAGSEANIDQYGYLLKIFSLLFDFAGVILLYKILIDYVKDTQRALILSLFVLLNIAYLYDTMLWAQVDAIMTTLVFFAFYFAVKEKVALTIIFSLLAVNMKLQAIIFLPFISLILFPTLLREFSIKNLLRWIILAMLVEFIITLPFLLEGDIESVWKVIKNSKGKYPYISMNAYNIWYWLPVGKALIVTLDTLQFLGISYNKWGLLMFATAYFVSLYPLIKNAWNLLLKKPVEIIPFEKLLLMGALVPLVFFYFNTQMHERYCHPALIFVGAFSVLSGRYFPYIIFSIGYMMNMEDVLKAFQWNNYGTVLMSGTVISGFFALAIISMWMYLYVAKKETI